MVQCLADNAATQDSGVLSFPKTIPPSHLNLLENYGFPESKGQWENYPVSRSESKIRSTSAHTSSFKTQMQPFDKTKARKQTSILWYPSQTSKTSSSQVSISGERTNFVNDSIINLQIILTLISPVLNCKKANTENNSGTLWYLKSRIWSVTVL